MKLLKIFTEEIDRMDANDPLSSVQTIIDGKRGVGFTSIDKSNIELIEKNGIKILPVRMESNNSMIGIVYHPDSKQEALQLFDIAKSKGGYLNDKTPEEAREIGQLLNYTENDIEEYVWRRYRSENVPSDNPDDYSDFH